MIMSDTKFTLFDGHRTKLQPQAKINRELVTFLKSASNSCEERKNNDTFWKVEDSVVKHCGKGAGFTI